MWICSNNNNKLLFVSWLVKVFVTSICSEDARSRNSRGGCDVATAWPWGGRWFLRWDKKLVAIKVLISFVTSFYLGNVVVRWDCFLQPLRMCTGSNFMSRIAVLWETSRIWVQFQGGSSRHNGRGGNGVLFFNGTFSSALLVIILFTSISLQSSSRIWQDTI
jgi:hypothetical protein